MRASCQRAQTAWGATATKSIITVASTTTRWLRWVVVFVGAKGGEFGSGTSRRTIWLVVVMDGLNSKGESRKRAGAGVKC